MDNLPFALFAELKKRIEDSKCVAIFAHKNPDGDSLGASIALSLVLDELGIKNQLICADAPGKTFYYLPKVHEYITEFEPSKYDLALIPDVGDAKLLKFPEESFAKVECIRIDHHATGNLEPKLKWVDSGFSATCEMLTSFFQFTKWRISPSVATCLLTGIYTDTGSFQHSNTTSRTLRMANFLTRKGANVRTLAKSIFQTTPISTLKLWGKVLSRIDKNADGVVVSAVKLKDYEECEAKREELSGVVDYLNAVEGNYSMLLTEEEENVKASLRTQKEEINVAEIAKKYGGGGHVKAAGFTVPGQLKPEIHWRIIKPGEEVSLDLNSDCDEEEPKPVQ